jgi:outer membrane protein OmpA-like peptidoglycan-associated protein
LIEHQAYLAQGYANIAEQRIEEAHARERVEQGEAERNRVLLDARTREAEAAERQARAAQNQAAVAQTQAAAAQERAQVAAAQAQAVARQNQDLQQALADLEAQATERGLVLTLGDVLFDTAAATLKPGAESTMDRLAEFMREYPERNLRIEGHTDARGEEGFNLDLSERRATAVRNALTTRGIDNARITTIGLGETYPVANNETAAGMQQNRRVEVVISDDTGAFERATMDRRAAAVN